MVRKLAVAFALALTLVAVPTKTTAQVSGIAWAEFLQGDALLGFKGPFRGTDTGVEIHYAVLCLNPITRAKAPLEVTAVIPDGSTLADVRSLSTTAVVNVCAQEGNITVPRGAVILPAVNIGQ